jgi:hypothetical protein
MRIKGGNGSKYAKEKLSLSIAYRLEAHSVDLIPALMWWKLVQKDVEQELRPMTKRGKKRKKR